MKTKTLTSLKWICKYAGNQLWWVAFLSVLTGIISFCFIYLALLSKEVLDIVTNAKNSSLLFPVLKILIVIITQGLLNIIYCNILIRAIGKIDIKIKQRLLQNILHKNLSEINKFHSGELLNRFVYDIDIIIDGVVTIIPNGISLLTRIVAGLIVLFKIEPLLTGAVLLLGTLILFCSKLFSNQFKLLHKNLQNSNGVVNSFIKECLENILVIKAFSNNIVILNKLKEKQNIVLKHLYKKQSVSNVANTGIYILFTGGYYLALIWGALKISFGSMTFGTLTAFLQIIEQIKAPMKNISGLIPTFYSMVSSTERLIEIENLQNENLNNVNLPVNEIYNNLISINVENLNFSYNNEKIFENANAIINKGEIVAISGKSGIGKSTLLKLMLSFYEKQSGNIYFNLKTNKIPITSEYRPLFSYVPQGNMIFSGSIKENISFFSPNSTDDEIINASKLAMIYDFILTLPNKFDTIIGERGLGLSEGQIQRIALARAFLSTSPILLLDEATSALDETNEVRILENIKTLSSKTCIIISHRPKTLEMCDRILYIKDKEIISNNNF